MPERRLEGSEVGTRKNGAGTSPHGGAPSAAPPLAPVVSVRDLYRLRRASLQTREAALRAQMAQHQLEALTLELELRYGLLGREATLDIHTGRVTETPGASPDGSVPR